MDDLAIRLGVQELIGEYAEPGWPFSSAGKAGGKGQSIKEPFCRPATASPATVEPPLGKGHSLAEGQLEAMRASS